MLIGTKWNKCKLIHINQTGRQQVETVNTKKDQESGANSETFSLYSLMLRRWNVN